MWKNLISSIASIGSAVYIYLIVAGISGAVFGYSAYSWTSDYYEVKIEHANETALKEKNDLQAKGDKLVAQYIHQITQLSANNANLQSQIALAVKHDNGASCVVSSGFVRVFNASTAGESSTPSSADGASSGIDEATLLSVIAQNNDKYNILKDKLTKLQEFERNNP